MKATLPAPLLKDTLSLLKAYQMPQDNVPATYQILAEVTGEGDGHLTLAMLGMINQAVISLPCTDAEPGEAMLPPAELIDALTGKLPMTLVSNQSGEVILERSERCRLRLETGSSRSFPPLDSPPREEWLDLNDHQTAVLSTLLRCLKLDRLAFGELVERNGKLCCAASDEVLLSYLELDVAGWKPERWVLHPSIISFIGQLHKTYTLPPEKTISIHAELRQAWVKFANGYFMSAQPVFTPVLPVEPFLTSTVDGCCEIETKTLLPEVKLACGLFTSDADLIHLTLREGRLHLQAKTNAKGYTRAVLPVNAEGSFETLVLGETLYTSLRAIRDAQEHPTVVLSVTQRTLILSNPHRRIVLPTAAGEIV